MKPRQDIFLLLNYFTKIAKGERQAKMLALFAWPNRHLSSCNKDSER